ncbi:MAG: aspartate--tRNA ligase [Candidatus Aminicenantaceae bacterium]
MKNKKREKKQEEWRRTAYCGELRKKHVGKQVTLFGWVQKLRDIGNLVFVDLRDREGLIQVVFSSSKGDLLEEAKKIRMESVVGIKGVVRKREQSALNPQLPTGEIEIEAETLEILSPSKVPPFVITDPPQASEELRFKYRFLDMRRPSMQRNMRLRHHAALCVRNFLSDKGFLEIETPFLTKSTPEGARDYLVPSRIYKGRFYALPQSPQLFKQMLMIAGFDRYFQIVRCFRDEDLRADRQPEFTQIDIEMSFTEREELFDLVEDMMASVFALIDAKVKQPFPRLTYNASLEKYGTDSPDIRSRMEIKDLSEVAPKIDSVIIKQNISDGGALKGLLLESEINLSRRELSEIDQRAKSLGGKGIIWIKKLDGLKSSLRIPEKDLNLIWENLDGEEKGLALLIADKKEIALKILGDIRRDLINQKKTNDTFQFAWVTDFPLFEWSEEEGRLVSMHHPFTSPHSDDLSLLEEDPLKVRAESYDLILNGIEIGGGSQRIHDVYLQKKIFKALGMSQKETEDKFGFFLEALNYGTPPHGGIALGFDRLVMMVAGEESIREVIPFPKTTSALCLLTSSPSQIELKQLEELGLRKIKK